MSGPSVERPFAAAMSVDPDPGSAAGGVIGAVLEQLGGAVPDLAVLFVSGSHLEHMADLVSAVHATVSPSTMLAVSAGGVLGGAIEVEKGPAVSLWAGSTGPVTPVRLEALDRSMILGVPADLIAGDTLLVLADPLSFPMEALFEVLPTGVSVVGGLSSAAGEPGGNRLWIDGVEHADGAVGVVFPSGVVTTIVSQGCRPIGAPWVVTNSDRHLVHELAGRPAIERLNELLTSLSLEDRLAARRGLHIGIVANEQTEEFTQGDFLIRAVMGVEQSSQALAVGANVEVGQVIQFHVRDPGSASDDLARMLSAEDRGSGGALVFTCNGRGTHLFPEPHHDAAMVDELIRGGIAGMFCAGEIGPIGTHNAVHGFTATVLAFRQLP
jgi:small ligand-binding sensory domain FIST